MMKHLIFYFILIFIIYTDCFSKSISRNSPTIVQIGIYLTHLEKIDIKTQTFDAEFYLNMKWKGNHPANNFELINANNFEKYLYQEWTEKDTNWLACKIRGTFRCKMDVSNFPLDKQELIIRIGDFDWISDSLTYKMNPPIMGQSKNIYSAEWDITSYQAKIVDYTEMGEKYSSLEYAIPVERKTTSFLIKILIPILIVMGVSMLNLFIDKKEFEACIGLGATSLLSIIALYFSISNNLPAVNYATTVDKMMMGSYIVIFIIMIEIVVAFNLIESKRDKLLVKIESLTKLLVPLCYFLFLIFIFMRIDLLWFIR